MVGWVCSLVAIDWPLSTAGRSLARLHRAKEAFAKAELEKLAASNLAMGKFQKERARKAAQERQQKAR
jgi:hypothetical protein